jgi:hypothetical protein
MVTDKELVVYVENSLREFQRAWQRAHKAGIQLDIGKTDDEGYRSTLLYNSTQQYRVRGALKELR